tara:strand:- start:584 stop:1276 length:693 start_codon:yes stop_codon:yes gene_type:complete
MVLKSAFNKTTVLIGLRFFLIGSLFGQLAPSFSGELIYKIKKINLNNLQIGFGNENPNTEEKLIIYAKDSLIKRVHFNSENGIQESIEHLSYGKKILLLSIDTNQYAVQLPKELCNDGKHADSAYKLSKKCFPKLAFAGLQGKPMLLSHPMLGNKLHIWYSKKLHPKYNSVYADLPGLPLKYYIASEKGLYLYELESFKRYDPPLSIFQIPIGCDILSFEDFLNLLENQK